MLPLPYRGHAGKKKKIHTSCANLSRLHTFVICLSLPYTSCRIIFRYRYDGKQEERESHLGYDLLVLRGWTLALHCFGV